jgi:hypothetical protein
VRAKQQVNVVAHQAIAVQVKRFSLLEVGNRSEERPVVAFAKEHRLAVVAPINHVVDQAVGDGTWRARHNANLHQCRLPDTRKIVLTPFYPEGLIERLVDDVPVPG